METRNSIYRISNENMISIERKQYKIDLSKVKTIEDIVSILEAMDLSIFTYGPDFPDNFKALSEKGLLIESNL